MKHLFTLCIVLFFMAGTQNTQAQTKEETIEWLNTNGKDFLTVENCTLDFNPTIWTVTYAIDKITDDFFVIKRNLYSAKLDKSEIDYATTYYKRIIYEDVSTITIKHDKCSAYFVVKGLSNFDASEKLYFNKDNEENAKRTLKAIMHLAKLSGAKENKQTF